MKAGGGGGRRGKRAELGAPEIRDVRPEGTGIGALTVPGEGAENPGGKLEMVPEMGGAEGGEAVPHGELEGRGGGSVGVGPTDGEYAMGQGGGGKEVEAAVESGQGNRSLEFEGGKTKLEVEARDGGEGDAEGGGEGFVKFDLQLRSVRRGVEDDEVGEGVHCYLGIPKAVDDSSRAVSEGGSRAGSGVCELVVAAPYPGANQLEVGVEGDLGVEGSAKIMEGVHLVDLAQDGGGEGGADDPGDVNTGPALRGGLEEGENF